MSSNVDENFWKRLYQGKWKISGNREENILSLIKEASFEDAKLVGFGAGSADFLPGKPERYGKKKGDPDIEIPSIDVAVEVTGTEIERVNVEDDLWVRPDKIENARDRPEKDTWVVHSLDRKGTLRAIHLTPDTIEKLLRLDKIHPTIRGTRETYIPIPANDPIVNSFNEFVSYLKKKKRRR